MRTRLALRISASLVTLSLVTSSASAQPNRPSAFLADSMFNFEVRPSTTKLSRRTDGQLVVGPLTGSAILTVVTARFDATRVLAKKGPGPGEAVANRRACSR